MPLLNVNADNLGTLCPFGPFNRICNTPDGIYLESGMLGYSMTYFDPETYKPAKYQYNAAYTPVVGTIYFDARMKDVLLGQSKAYIGKTYRVDRIYYTPAQGRKTLESKAIGCATKSDSVTMINPRGDEAVCSYAYTAKIKSPPEIPNMLTLNGLMDYVNSKAVLATTAESAQNSDGVITRCVAPDRTSEEYKENGNKVFCSPDIINKKFCRSVFPPSMFSGKLRLYIQCLYGGTTVPYELSQSYGALKNLHVGMNLDAKDRAPRMASFGRGTHWLFTYNYHHFLISRATFGVNMLVPVGLGHQLKDYLQRNPQGLDKNILDNLEAYLLSVSAPTYTFIPTGASTSALTKCGIPLDFGLNGNWNGDSAVMVAYKSTPDNYRITSIVTVSVQCSGIEDFLDIEMDRKCASLVLDWRVKKGTAVYPFGVYRHYVTDAICMEIPDPDNPGQTKEVITGDVNDGAWWYSVHTAVGDTQPHIEELQKQAAAKNRIWGGQPYTEEFFTDIKGCFNFSVEQSDETVWVESYQQDKIFAWDPFYQDYEWKFACNPKDPSLPCHPATSGTFPVYAYYTRSGKLVVAYYTHSEMSAGENYIIPPEGLCGPGSDSEASFTTHEGKRSGFIVDSTKAVGESCLGYDRYNGNWGISGGSWGEWVGGCDGGFCDGGTYPKGGYIGGFWTHWVRFRTGPGFAHSSEGTGGKSMYSFILIPKSDCQGIHFGMLQEQHEDTHEVSAQYSQCPNGAQASGIKYLGTTKVVGNESWGWITCFSIYRAKSFGTVYRDGGTPSHPVLFATGNWCIYFPGGSEVGNASCNFRGWGPLGNDTGPATGNIGPSLYGYTGGSDKYFLTVTKTVVGYFVGTNGTARTTAQSGGTGTSDSRDYGEAEAQILLANPYAVFLKPLDIDWPYAGCGDTCDAFSTTQTSGQLTRIIGGAGDGLIPKPWPFTDGCIHPVGYV